MSKLNTTNTTNQQLIKTLYNHKSDVSQIVANSQSDIRIIEKKFSYLDSYVTLLTENKEALNQRIQDVINTRIEIESEISSIASSIQNESFTPARNRPEQYQALQELTPQGAESLYALSWPILPITNIEYYFQDTTYQNTYDIPHRGIRIAIPQ
jgi:DNA-binding NarL/FixJ family response regulator